MDEIEIELKTKEAIAKFEENLAILSEKDRESPLSGFYSGLMSGFMTGVRKTVGNPDLSDEEKRAEIQRLYDIISKAGSILRHYMARIR